MGWIVDIYVRARAWIRSFYFLVASSVIAAVEGSMDSLLCNYLILDVILLLLVVVLAWSWHLGESLSGVWRLALVLPELSSLGLGEE